MGYFRLGETSEDAKLDIDKRQPDTFLDCTAHFRDMTPRYACSSYLATGRLILCEEVEP